jgi:hypothetical protein
MPLGTLELFASMFETQAAIPLSQVRHLHRLDPYIDLADSLPNRVLDMAWSLA